MHKLIKITCTLLILTVFTIEINSLSFGGLKNLCSCGNLLNSGCRSNLLGGFGNKCSCGNEIVRPVNLGPARRYRNGFWNTLRNNDIGHTRFFGGGFREPANCNAAASNDLATNVPADPVSLELAYRLASNAAKSLLEGNFLYGYRKPTVVDNTKSGCANGADDKENTDNTIAEERLWSIVRPAVELNQATDNKKPEQLNYNQVGYYRAKAPANKFQIVHHHDIIETVSNDVDDGSNNKAGCRLSANSDGTLSCKC